MREHGAFRLSGRPASSVLSCVSSLRLIDLLRKSPLRGSVCRRRLELPAHRVTAPGPWPQAASICDPTRVGLLSFVGGVAVRRYVTGEDPDVSPNRKSRAVHAAMHRADAAHHTSSEAASSGVSSRVRSRSSWSRRPGSLGPRDNQGFSRKVGTVIPSLAAVQVT